jgi:hypothetical protein
MISLTINKNGELLVVQQASLPTVYLDHWALRKISENPSLANRLTVALESRKGTLALSWLNLVEFTKVTEEEQARKAENFLEANLPHVFFLEVDPFAVIQREDELLAGGPPIAPHADADTLRAFALLKPASPSAFTARDLFKIMQNDQPVSGFNKLADTFVGRVEALRNELDTNPEFQSAVNRLPTGPQIQRGTRYVLRELIRPFLVDKKIRITRNHGIDFMHAVVPVAYCELVLLDKHWEAQVGCVRSRLNAAGMSVPIGRVFSGKANGIDRFVNELESN